MLPPVRAPDAGQLDGEEVVHGDDDAGKEDEPHTEGDPDTEGDPEPEHHGDVRGAVTDVQETLQISDSDEWAGRPVVQNLIFQMTEYSNIIRY